MNNEEIKKKIVEILDNNIRWQPYYYISRGIVYEDDLKNIADALIAAGLTFEPMTFRIVENKLYSYTAGELANWKEDQDRIAKLLHRAEVAEKALKHAVNVYIAHTETSSKKKWWYKYFLREAEKELAEEEKDGNKTD